MLNFNISLLFYKVTFSNSYENIYRQDNYNLFLIKSKFNSSNKKFVHS